MEEDELEALLDDASTPNVSPPNSPLGTSFLESSSLPSSPHTPGHSVRSSRQSDSPRRESSTIEEARPRRNGSSISNGVTSNNAGVMGKEGKRFSLAFELASAGNTVGRGDNRLGIDEDELREEEEVLEGYSDELDSEEEALGEREGFMGNGFTENRDSEDGFGRSGTGLMDEPGGEIDSDVSNSQISSTDGDLTFDETTTALEDSLRTTELFLVHLRQHTITESDTLSPHSLSSPLSTSLQRNNKSSNYVDRQPVIELLAATLIKSLYEAVKVREGQNRELSIIEKEISETNEAWEVILGGLDELEEDEEMGDTLFFIASGRRTSIEVVEDLVEDPSFVTREDGSSDEDHSTTLAPPHPSSTRPSTQSRPTLSSLRTTTSSLLSTLSTLSDHAQISRSSTTEAARKLRSLRSQLASFVDDLASLAQSEEYIRLFEAVQLRAVRKEEGGTVGMGKGRYGRQARDCLRGVESALEGFESRRKMLVVV